MAAADIVLVTVTYGARGHLLAQLVDRFLGEDGRRQVIVVSNAATSDFTPILTRWPDRVKLISLEKNGGSANGYAMGIGAALQTGAPYIWLMDDDNVPAIGTGAILRAELIGLCAQYGRDTVAVSGFRRTRSGRIKRFDPPSSMFLGFDITDGILRLWRQLTRPHIAFAPRLTPADMSHAPYGGFMTTRETLMRIGLPLRDLVIYADDWEFTSRITRAGGVIRCLPAAAIDDVDTSWYGAPKRQNKFLRHLCGGADFQLYYSFRNHVWLSSRRPRRCGLLYRLNRSLFLLQLKYFARHAGKPERLAVLLQAIADGEAGRLGIHPNFPLP